MTGITPERIAELRSRLNRLPSKLDLNTMWHAAYGLLDEVDRLRALNAKLRGLMATAMEWLVERSMRPSCECDPSELVKRLKEIEP